MNPTQAKFWLFKWITLDLKNFQYQYFDLTRSQFRKQTSFHEGSKVKVIMCYPQHKKNKEYAIFRVVLSNKFSFLVNVKVMEIPEIRKEILKIHNLRPNKTTKLLVNSYL